MASLTSFACEDGEEAKQTGHASRRHDRRASTTFRFTPDKEVKWPPGKMAFTGPGSTHMAGGQEQEVQNECSA